jgi:hypothetical protein
MAIAGSLGKMLSLGAETHQNDVATLYPSGANRPKPENLLKTKARERRFSCAKPENMLKKQQLPKLVGTQSVGDKLFHQAMVSTRGTRLSFACKARRESGRV